MTVKTRKIVKIVSIALAAVLTVTGSVFGFVEIGKRRLRESLSFTDNNLTSSQAYGDNAEVFHKGQGYVYNDNLINILCIGVDKQDKNEKRSRQADALYLLSLDTQKNQLNILAISRNTLADIDIYDVNNEFLDTDNAQICLSYAYGKDDKNSSLLTCKAVSKFLYDVPINSYYTIYMDGVTKVVDSVGGVKVTLAEDLSACDKNWQKGKQITLKSGNVLKYLQYREESNEPRMQRHIGFIKEFVNSAKATLKKDISLPVDLYKKISKNSVTDIDVSEITYLITEISKAKVDFHSVKGKTGSDGIHETFIADDEALFETVLNLFYIKTN